MILLLSDLPERIGAPVLGIVIPALILIIAMGLTWLLYRHFSKPH